MTRPTNKRITQRAAIDSSASSGAVHQVVAHPVDAPAVQGIDPQVSSLLNGLSTFHKGVAQYVAAEHTQGQKDQAAAGKAAAEAEQLAGGIPSDPNAAVMSASAIPSTVPQAFRGDFQQAFNKVIAENYAVGVHNDAMAEWAKVHDTNEDPNGFIKDFYAKHTHGITDPSMLAALSSSAMQTSMAIRADATKIATARLTQQTKDGVQGLYSSIDASMSPAQVFSKGRVISDVGVKTGLYTRTEMAASLLSRIDAVSAQRGGDPELYSAFTDFKDPSTGKSLADMNPKLGVLAATHMRIAMSQLDKRVGLDRQGDHLDKLNEWATGMAEGKYPTLDEIKAEIGPMGIFKTGKDAFAYYSKVQAGAASAAEGTQALLLADHGLLYTVQKQETRKKVVEALTGHDVGLLIQTANDPSTHAQSLQNAAVASLIHTTDKIGSNEPNPTLKRFFSTFGVQMPGKDAEPTPQFLMAARVYAQLTPAMKAAYVDKNTSQILSTYNDLTSNGATANSDPKSALAASYAAVSPEGRAMAEKLKHDPQFTADVTSWVHKGYQHGWFGSGGALGFQMLGTFPTNEDRFAQAAVTYATELKMRNPNMSENVLKDHVQTWYANHLVYEPNSNLIVQTPGGMANKETAAALSGYMADAQAKYGKDSGLELRYKGSGIYQLWGGNGSKLIEDQIPLTRLTDEEYFKHHLDAAERHQMIGLRTAVMNGTATPDQLAKGHDLIVKARTIGAWSSAADDKLRARQKDLFHADFNVPIEHILPDPSNLNLGVAARMTDPKTTTSMAHIYWSNQQEGKALTVMGEGVRLKVYKDTRGISTIGVGYNLQSNAATLSADFRKAGVPADQIENVKEGKAQLSQDQAMRLFSISYDRANEGAQRVLESRYGKDAWSHLSKNRRAVLVDLAYQLGPTGMSHFPKAMKALMDGDLEKAKEEIKVHGYPGRNNLRSQMILGGLNGFGSIIKEVASKPANVIDAAANSQPNS